MRRLLRDGVADAPRRDGDPPGGVLRRRGGRLPHTEAAARDSLMLPLFAGLTDEQQDRVVASLVERLAAVLA